MDSAEDQAVADAAADLVAAHIAEDLEVDTITMDTIITITTITDTLVCPFSLDIEGPTWVMDMEAFMAASSD